MDEPKKTTPGQRERAARIRRFRRLSWRQRSHLLLNRLERRLARTTLLTGPRTLDIVPTHRCNLRCVGCVQYLIEGPKDLTIDFFTEILDESAPWAIQYRLCSLGEPFMNKDVPEMLRLAAERGIGVNTMTNGMLITEDLADFIVANCSVDIFSFSIDGATAETCERLRRGLKWDRLFAAIASITEAKGRHGRRDPVIQANFTAMRSNVGELPDLVRLASRTGIEDVNVNYLTVEARTALEDSLFEVPDEQAKAFREAERVADQRGIVLHLPPDIADRAVRTRCILPWDTLIIDTDGTARMCYASWEETVGNVKTDGGILRVWNNAIYRKVRETIETPRPFYRYCAQCGRRVGFSRLEAHVGKNEENCGSYSFDWERSDAPPRPGGTRLHNPDSSEES